MSGARCSNDSGAVSEGVFVQEDRDAGGSASCFERKASKKGRRSGIERGITGDVGTRHPSPLRHLKYFQGFVSFELLFRSPRL